LLAIAVVENLSIQYARYQFFVVHNLLLYVCLILGVKLLEQGFIKRKLLVVAYNKLYE
jgi:hypothetical protein